MFLSHGTEGYPEENWFPWLKDKLEKEGCNVYVPHFPSPPGVPAKISEWFAVLKHYERYLNEDAIVVAHSLGGLFALRILENILHPVKAVCFVGTPIGVMPIANYERDSAFCGFDFAWNTIQKNAKHFVVFQSDNDPYVSIGNGETLAKKLGVDLTFIPNAGHFNKSAGFTAFEELFATIKSLLDR
jgi:predicted alpha/beta hydrolase family esterase